MPRLLAAGSAAATFDYVSEFSFSETMA